jgi:hypothetical protein
MTPLPDSVSVLLRTNAAAAMAALLLISVSHRDLFASASEAIRGEEPASLPPKAKHAARRTHKENGAVLNPTFGHVDPTTHVFTPTANGSAYRGDCLKRAPGLTDAGVVCGGGGGGVGGPVTIYTTHSGVLATPTPTGSWTVLQQGFYAPGDGGAATYNWSASSYCAGGTSGFPTPADGFVCILPSGQAASTPGRYLQELTNGVLNVATLGFKDDGTDNSSEVSTLNTVLSHYLNMGVNFPLNPQHIQSNYWFSQPLEITNSTSISCGAGTRQFQQPTVNLVFGPGISGVRFEGFGVPGLAGNGVNIGTLNGCGVVSVGYGGSVGYYTIAGNTTIQNVRIATPAAIAYGAVNSEPLFSLGDSIALFPGAYYWNFSGAITGNVLTVTKWGGGGSATDRGIAVGQMVQAAGVPIGTYIKATHNEDPTYTGIGQTGTYEVYPSIASPIVPAQANPGTLSRSFQTEVQTGQPLAAPGTTVVGCSTLSGLHCGQNGTLTLSNAPRLGQAIQQYLLPGPNTSYAYGSQMYNVTTSLTGQTYGPFRGGISNGSGGSGNILNVTGGGGSGLNLGQVVIGTGGSPVSTTTTSPLTVGEYANIPVTSCAGIAHGMFVVGTASGGHAVFPPGTSVDACTRTSLSVTLQEGGPAAAAVTSGSNIANIASYYYPPYQLWIGLPMTGTNIPANTTVNGPVSPWPYAAGEFNVPMSNHATGTSSAYQSISFGGAIYAAPPSTTLTFLNGAANIYHPGTGTGGNGTYYLDSSALLASGSTLYAFDTPATIYVTGGPRMIQPQDLIWSDAFRFGTVAAKIYGITPSRLTVITAITNSYGTVSAQVAHSAGSGNMWMLPDGLARNVSGNSYGNLVDGFGIGLNMACAANNNYPLTGCGRSLDSNNFFQHNLVGRLTAGNNSGGSASEYNEYDHNFVADVAELATVGSSYLGEMLQGLDESSNTHDLVSGCLTNGSIFTGVYASGSGWEGSCYAGKDQMLGDQPGFGFQFSWFGALYGGPADALFVPGVSIGTTASCTGTPTSSFHVVNGVVTHC